MALIARTQALYPSPSAASAHAIAASHYAASTSSSVEELDATAGSSFESAITVGGEESQERPGSGRQGRVTQPLVRMIVNATTQAFAALVEFQGQPATAGSDSRLRPGPRLLSKAIATYESNARVISGVNYAPGGTISLTL